MISLGTLGGDRSYGQAINDAGQVAGYSTLSGDTGAYQAFRWTGGVMQALGTLGGTKSEAIGINASGVTIGYSFLLGDQNYRAFYYDGTMHNLGTLPGKNHSIAQGINASGVIVGDATDRAFVWDGAMHDLNDLIAPGFGWTLTNALAINDAGQITGIGRRGNFFRAFLLTPTSVPEPASWGLLIGGFGIVGAMARQAGSTSRFAI